MFTIQGFPPESHIVVKEPGFIPTNITTPGNILKSVENPRYGIRVCSECVRYPFPPFGFINSLVLLEQGLPILTLQLIERGGQMVVNKHILCTNDAQSLLLHAAAIIIVFKEPPAECLVKGANALIHVASQHHAEEGRCPKRQGLPDVPPGISCRDLEHFIHALV